MADPRSDLINVIASQDYNANILGICQRLLAEGADPKDTDNNGNTPLIWAAFRGHLDIVRLLLPLSDVYAKDCGGQDALANAQELGNDECAELIKAFIRSTEEAKAMEAELTAKTNAVKRKPRI